MASELDIPQLISLLSLSVIKHCGATPSQKVACELAGVAHETILGLNEVTDRPAASTADSGCEGYTH